MPAPTDCVANYAAGSEYQPCSCARHRGTFCTMCSFKALGVWECAGCGARSCRHVSLIDHARTCPVPAIAGKA